VDIQDQFGFLPNEDTYNLNNCKIEPVDNYKESYGQIKKFVHRDDFIYPPIAYAAKLDPVTFKEIEKVPNSERPALIHRLPPSHNIEIKNYKGNIVDSRLGLSSFIINLLAYLYGTRLQFFDWWFDSRIPWELQSFTVTKAKAEDFLNKSISEFDTWSSVQQKRFINILFMHTRSVSYEWDWERFTIEYMVLDGIWRFVAEQGRIVKKVNHEERIKCLCETYGLTFLDLETENIVNLRNNLFHETLWDNGQPCTASGNKGFEASGNLRRLNQRLIPVVLKYDTDFIKTKWSSISHQNF